MKSDDLQNMDFPPTEIPFPEGLQELLIHFPVPRIQRTLVFVDSGLLPIPGRDYQISYTGLVIPHPIKTLSVVSLVLPGTGSERWKRY